MLWVWITLCLSLQGTCSFMIHNNAESLCLEDSHGDAGVLLKRCNVDSELQQWVWIEQMFLMNVRSQRCLSADHSDPIKTLDCDGQDNLHWQCMNHRLIGLSHSLELGVFKGKLALTNTGKSTTWKSLDQGNICQEKLRSRRQTETEDEFPPTQYTMTEEQREFLRWYYRSEDPTAWNFAMLGLSLVALLGGCMLCVMAMMGNKHRREIAKYKAATAVSSAAVKVEMEELQIKEDKESYTDQTNGGQLDSKASLEDVNETDALKPGDIMVTWKDGNVSKLCSDSHEEDGEDSPS